VSAVTTEQQNPRTRALDAMSVTELLLAMNDEDRRVPVAVAAAIPQIARAVDLAVSALGAGGRLIYLGAGTSGRLGVLDAAECPPTFGTDPGQVRGCSPADAPRCSRPWRTRKTPSRSPSPIFRPSS
jgi:N-acetylmuramic acid 6-phosphate etherase